MPQVRCYRKHCLYREPLINKETVEDNTYNTCKLRDIILSNNGRCLDYDEDGCYANKSKRI
jgi:hypothetical protein